jgi:hypothetical protein
MAKRTKNATFKAVKKQQNVSTSGRTDVSEWLLGILSEEYNFPVARISLNGALDDWGYGSTERLASLAAQFNRSSANAAKFNYAKISPPDLIRAVRGKTLADIITCLEGVVVAAGRALYVPIGQELTDIISPHVLALGDPTTSLLGQVTAWVNCYLANNGLQHADLSKVLFGSQPACEFLEFEFDAYAQKHWNGAVANAGELGHVKTFKGLIDYLFKKVKSAIG